MYQTERADRYSNHPGGFGHLTKETLITRRSLWRPQEVYDELVLQLSYNHLCTNNLQWLDVGSGNGVYAESLAQALSEVTPQQFHIMKLDHANLFMNKPSAILADARNTPLSTHSIDLVTARWMVHWGGLDTYAHEFARVTKPGGLLLIDTITPYNNSCVRKYEGLDEVHSAVLSLPHQYKLDNFVMPMTAVDGLVLERQLNEVGFEVLEMGEYKNDFPNGLGDEYKECIACIAKKV